MATIQGTITSQPAANTLTGAEVVPGDQQIGSPVAAPSLVPGQTYQIVSLGSTVWSQVGAGENAAIGTVFQCEATGSGTGTAQRIDTRRILLSAVATLAAASPTLTQAIAAAIAAHVAAADAHPAYQPLDADLTAIAAVANQTAYGRAFLALADAGAARAYVGLAPTDSLTLTGLTLTGTATLPHIHGNLAGSLYAHVKNLSGAQLVAGTPVRSVGTVGNTITLEVVAADASSPSTMPATLVLSETLAANGEGHAVAVGEIQGLNTSGMTAGAPLYVRPGGGLFTATRPTANAQQVAAVGRVHATTGSIQVLPWPVLGNAAALNVGTTTGSLAAGDDSRIVQSCTRGLAAGLAIALGG